MGCLADKLFYCPIQRKFYYYYVNIRHQAIRLILAARKRGTHKIPRKFMRPQELNFDAKVYHQIVNLSKYSAQITEPPLTMGFSNKELLSSIKKATNMYP